MYQTLVEKSAGEPGNAASYRDLILADAGTWRWNRTLCGLPASPAARCMVYRPQGPAAARRPVGEISSRDVTDETSSCTT